MRYLVTNLTRKTVLATEARRADTFFTRFKGLMGVTELPIGHGLLISPCNSVHTFFMRIAIDVVFLDAQYQVVDIAPALAPWRVSRLYLQAKSVLELPAGTTTAALTQPTDQLQFEPVTS
jgi:uncharacterized protein